MRDDQLRETQMLVLQGLRDIVNAALMGVQTLLTELDGEINSLKAQDANKDQGDDQAKTDTPQPG